MEYKYLLVSNTELRAQGSVGYRYAISHRSDWVNGPEIGDVGGFNRGNAFVVKDSKAYEVHKVFFLIDESTYLVVCKESVQGCDVL